MKPGPDRVLVRRVGAKGDEAAADLMPGRIDEADRVAAQESAGNGGDAGRQQALAAAERARGALEV